MAYTKQTWTDGSGGGTPVSAARLGYMETGIEAAAATADAAAATAATKSNRTRTVQAAKTGSYTVVAGDLDTVIPVNAAATITLSPGLGAGFICEIVRLNASGAVTIAPGAGVTIVANIGGTPQTGTRTLNGQYASVVVEAVSADTFLVVGQIA